MKKFLFVLICSGVCLVSFAQSKDERAVATAVDSLTAAMVSSNIASLTKWTDDGLSYGHSSALVQDKTAFLDNFISGKSDFVTIDLTDQKITVSGKTAIVRHTLNATTNDSGKPGTVKLSILLVWTKSGKIWKLLARQAVKTAA
jgi:hypothetical protein